MQQATIHRCTHLGQNAQGLGEGSLNVQCQLGLVCACVMQEVVMELH